MQNTIDRNDFKDKNRDREYRENRHCENEISRDKTKKFKNNDFFDLSKINCFKCCQKNYYVRDYIVFKFVNESKKNQN